MRACIEWRPAQAGHWRERAQQQQHALRAAGVQAQPPRARRVNAAAPALGADSAQVFADWGPRGTVHFPGAWKTFADGQPLLDSKVTAVTFNPELADDLFRKPSP